MKNKSIIQTLSLRGKKTETLADLALKMKSYGCLSAFDELQSGCNNVCICLFQYHAVGINKFLNCEQSNNPKS